MDESSKDVVILGAGFSKAVHEAFPVLSELAERVEALLEDRAAPSTKQLVDELRRVIAASLDTTVNKDRRPVVDFEGWLSRIAMDQPHLSASENYERHALFAHAATAIRDLLLGAEDKAFSTSPLRCLWPYHLMWLLDTNRTVVITMNYDTIVERLAVSTLWPWQVSPLQLFGQPSELLSADLFDNLPPTLPPPPTTYRVLLFGRHQQVSRVPPSTFSLLKLHGSLDWFAARGDPTGATLVRFDTGRGPGSESKAASDHPPGREPFLVPPDGNKSSYLANPIVRELWGRSRAALENASSVTLVGYSLPTTDTTFAGLLADTIGAQAGLQVTIVDLEPDPVGTRLQALGITDERIEVVGGDRAIERWVEQAIDKQVSLTAQRLCGLLAYPRARDACWDITVEFGSPYTRGYSAFRFVEPSPSYRDRTQVLALKPAGNPTFPPARALLDLLPPAQATKVAVENEGESWPIIDYYLTNPSDPSSCPKISGQLVLLPLTTPHDRQQLPPI